MSLFPQLEALWCSLFKHEIRLDEICTHQFSPMTAPSVNVIGKLLAKLVFSHLLCRFVLTARPWIFQRPYVTVHRGRGEKTEQKRAHVIVRLSDVISMDTHCIGKSVCCCDFYTALRGERWDVLHWGHVLVAPVHIWSKSAFFGAGGLSWGADKAPSSWLSLLCHQQIGGPCGTLHHCSSIFGRKLRWIWEVRSISEVWADQPLADQTHLNTSLESAPRPWKRLPLILLNPDRRSVIENLFSVNLNFDLKYSKTLKFKRFSSIQAPNGCR